MANEREMLESAMRSYEERIHHLKTLQAKTLADLVQRDARIAVLETDLGIAIAQLSTREEDVLFTADFVIECEDPEDV